MDFTGRKQILLLGLISLGLAGKTFAESVTLIPSADTSLFAAFPDNNLGATPNIVVGVNGTGSPGRGLIRFDLAGQIPSTAVIQLATLTVKVLVVPAGGGVPSILNVRRVLRDWGEGVGTGNSGVAANAGEATWNNRFHPATDWFAPGGAVSNDFSGVVSAAMLFTNLGSYDFNSTPELVADVQAWVSGPATNFGWVLISESEDTAFTARRLGSRENNGNEPALTIQYTVPLTPDIQGINVIGGQVWVSFAAQAGQPYTVQFCDSLVSGTWQTLTNFSSHATTTNVMIVDPFPTNSQRYYRIGNF